MPSKILVIFPAKKEDTIELIIGAGKKSGHNPEVIVIDAYSSDATVNKVRNSRAPVIEQVNKFFSGNGIAMKNGNMKAINSNVEIVLFLN
jgi:hypothetical protein